MTLLPTTSLTEFALGISCGFFFFFFSPRSYEFIERILLKDGMFSDDDADVRKMLNG